ELFRRHLEPAAGKRYHIETCVPVRFRCRQSAARSVLQYTLRRLEPGTGRRWEQGVSGLVYAEQGAAERLWREMQAADPCQGIPADWLTFRPVGFIPDLEMVVQLFPYDRKLRNLRLVLGDALHDLDPQLLARLAPGEWRVTERTMAPTRYRTELGAALKYTLQARDAATGGAATLRDVGSGAVARSSLAVQLEELRRGATIVEWARPELATHVRAITAAVAAGLEEVPPAPIHGDLKPDHVFLAGDRVIFIDLDSVVLGVPVRDPAHMLAYVSRRDGLD